MYVYAHYPQTQGKYVAGTVGNDPSQALAASSQPLHHTVYQQGTIANGQGYICKGHNQLILLPSSRSKLVTVLRQMYLQ